MTDSLQKAVRKQYLGVYLLVLVVVGLGSAFALRGNYIEHRDNITNQLHRDAHASASVIEGVLVDATKILDVAQPRITKSINAGTLTDEAAYRILDEARNVFSLFISNEPFFLTIYVDENGLVRASSKGVSQTHFDVSERVYFQALKKNPKLRYAIGNLVPARITNLLTFHVAIPIVDKDGKFRGVIAQQVLASELVEKLKELLNESVLDEVLVHLANGKVAFNYPNPAPQSEGDAKRNAYISEKVLSSGQDSGVLEVHANELLPQSTYVGYAISRAYGFVISASYPKSAVVISFLKENSSLIAYCVFAFVILTFGMWRFYKSTVKINSSLMLSFTDSLTGLKNRRAFDAEFPKLWKEAIRSGQPISALFIDIDHFKRFNDDFGHECGDIALVTVAKMISKCVTRPMDFCCRWGGEEFAVILPQTNERGAILLAKEILDAVRSAPLDFPCEAKPHITVSVGIATMVVNDSNKTDDLVDMADKAMYVAKQSGRDRYSLLDASLAS